MPLLLLRFPERALGLTSFHWSSLTCWLKPVGMSYHHWSPYPSSSFLVSLSCHGSELFSSPLWNLAGMAPAREVELRSAARAHWPSRRRRTPTSLAEGRGADRRSRFKKEGGEENESISLTWSRRGGLVSSLELPPHGMATSNSLLCKINLDGTKLLK